MIWSRWSGAGNTFFILKPQPNQHFNINRPQIAKALCSQFPNAPTDGVLFLDEDSSADAKWDFFNSDGSSAEMCGNAARCAAGFLYRLNESQKTFSFLTKAGRIAAEIVSNQIVEVEMPELQVMQKLPVYYVNSGVPHVVLESEFDLVLAQKYRPYPQAPGSNVTFVSDATKRGARAVTFERGVEGPTLACGTGAVAAAAFLSDKFGPLKFEIEMPGGRLEVENAVDHRKPLMRGPAVWSFDFDDGNIWEGN